MVESQLSDDLTSIASDLETGLRHYREGDIAEALWWWQFSYVSSWGNLAGVSLNALLSVVAHDRLDAEFTGEDEDVAAANEMLDEGEPATNLVSFGLDPRAGSCAAAMTHAGSASRRFGKTRPVWPTRRARFARSRCALHERAASDHGITSRPGRGPA